MSLLSRAKTPLLKNTGSCARDHLASERTFLAWIRTGLGFIALGIAVERFSQLDLESLVRELRPSIPTPNNITTTTASPSPASVQSTKSKEDEEEFTAREKEQTLVGALLGTGTGSIIYGTARYFSNLRLIERGEFKPAFHGAAVLSVAVAGMAGAAYWNTMRHGVKMREKRERERKEREEKERERRRREVGMGRHVGRH